MKEEYIKNLQQIVTEDSYNRNRIYNMVKEDIEESYKDIIGGLTEILFRYFTEKMESKTVIEASIGSNLYPKSFDIALDILIAVCGTAKKTQTIQAVISKLLPSLDISDIKCGAEVATQLLARGSTVGAYKLVKTTKGNIIVMSDLVLSPEVLVFIEKAKFLPPLVCKPDEINSNYTRAYKTKEAKGALMLGAKNVGPDNIVFDSLNIASNIKLSLNKRILDYKEVPNKPLDTQYKVDAFNMFSAASREVYDYILEQGNEFYLEHRPDFRGREYSSGYHINIQGTDYKKALIELADKEVIGL